MTLRAMLAVAMVIVPSLVFAAGDAFSKRFALTLRNDSVYNAITLPQQVYAASARSDLGDVRVLNGAGEPVPYSLDAPSDSTIKPAERRAVRWFPLPEESSASATSLGVTIAADGTLKAVSGTSRDRSNSSSLLDLGNQDGTVTALLIHLADAGFQGRVSVEMSDNLRDWRMIGETQMLKLTHGADQLIQERIELTSGASRYVRLKWLDGVPKLASVEVETSAQAESTPPIRREWRAAVAVRPGSTQGEYLFAIDGRYPVDRLRLGLPQINTIAHATIYSRADARMPWKAVASNMLYRLKSPAGEQNNPPLEFSAVTDREWRLLVDARDGGLGSGPVSVQVGWRPDTLTFVARGSGPFVLVAGNASMMSIARSRQDLLMSGTPEIAPATVRESIAVSPENAAAPDERHHPESIRLYVLWCALLLAVGTLAVLAYRLARSRPNETT